MAQVRTHVFRPDPLLRFPVRALSDRKNLDRGSLMLSNPERHGEDAWEDILPEVKAILGFPPLTPHYTLSIATGTLRDVTHVTMVTHEGLLTRAELNRLLTGLGDAAERLTRSTAHGSDRPDRSRDAGS